MGWREPEGKERTYEERRCDRTKEQCLTKEKTLDLNSPPPEKNKKTGCPGTNAAEAGKASACAGCPNAPVCAAAGAAAGVAGAAGAAAAPAVDPDVAAIAARLSGVRHKVLVLSGKGGVGKSTVAAQLAHALAARGKDVGLLDVDLCGPSAPRMLGASGRDVHGSGSGWSPVAVSERLSVMSIGFLLPGDDDAVIWRGPRKNALIKQFLRDVDWGGGGGSGGGVVGDGVVGGGGGGEAAAATAADGSDGDAGDGPSPPPPPGSHHHTLDVLIIDAPPGTSDEHISLAQLLGATAPRDGAVIVTTPQEVALADVRKEVSFCLKVGLPMLGIVENMAGLVSPLEGARFVLGRRGGGGGGGGGARGAGGAGEDVTERARAALEREFGPPSQASRLSLCLPLFHAAPDAADGTRGGGEALAKAVGTRFLGRIPADAGLSRASEEGRAATPEDAPFAAAALEEVVDAVWASLGEA